MANDCQVPVLMAEDSSEVEHPQTPNRCLQMDPLEQSTPTQENLSVECALGEATGSTPSVHGPCGTTAKRKRKYCTQMERSQW